MRKAHVVGILVACLVSLAVGFWAGLQQAFWLGQGAHALLRGDVATRNLEALRAGKNQAVATSLEFEIELGLMVGGDFLDDPLRRLLVPPLGISRTPLVDYEQQGSRMASYRSQHPSPFSSSNPASEAIINERIKRYAETAPNRAVERHAPKSEARPSP